MQRPAEAPPCQSLRSFSDCLRFAATTTSAISRQPLGVD